MFTPGGLIAGAVAAVIIGMSKTGLPGSALAAVPLVALVVDGRLIPGATLPLLIVGDLFAIAWYHRFARWDVLRGLAPSLGVGFALGITFFVLVGTATRQLERSIGIILVVIVVFQIWRMFRETSSEVSRAAVAGFGTGGGFTTFVANAAGPLINTYLATMRPQKSELLGTAAWLYFAVNLAKIPFYLALGAWSDGGPFFTGESLLWNLALIPGILLGVVAGRVLYHRIPQRQFLLAVLVLSAVGAVLLII